MYSVKTYLAIDIETFSDVNLPRCGVYAYVDSPKFEILLLAYAFNNGDTKVVDIACGEKIPREVVEGIQNENVLKTAFNAAFERICLSKHLNEKLSPKSWLCTAVQASQLALPMSLEGVGEVINIQRKKLKEGTDLIKYFTMPCKPTKANNGRTRNLPEHDMKKWIKFKSYCIRDVDAEREIRQKLMKYPISKEELFLYQLDQEINDRGILVDLALVSKAIECDLMYKDYMTTKAYELTGLENPNSVSQVKGWLFQKVLM